jgi:hypothetical protein
MSDVAEGTGAPAPEVEKKPEPKPEIKHPEAKAKPDGDPEWLSPRLERERKQLLKELGIDNPEDAKAALKAYREEQDRQKSEVQKLTERNIALEAKAKRAEELEEAIKASADAEMASLSADQREAVSDIAGDDPAKVLRAIKRLAPTWAVAPKAPAAPAAAPTDTAPPRDAPNGDRGTESQPDHKARYQQLKSENPVQAAYYLQQHSQHIFPRA